MRDFHRDKCFRDKIRDIRFQDKKTFEVPVSINSILRIEIPVLDETGFFEILQFEMLICPIPQSV